MKLANLKNAILVDSIPHPPPPPQWSSELPTQPGLWLFGQLITEPNFDQHYAKPRVYRVSYDKRRNALVAQENHNDTRPLSALVGVWLKLPELPRSPSEATS